MHEHTERDNEIIEGGNYITDQRIHRSQLDTHLSNRNNKRRFVYTIRCIDCKTTLCERGMRAMLLSNTNIHLYSTDTPMSTIQLAGHDYYTINCKCLIRDVGCSFCGNIIGYHITQPCEYCLKSKNNGHLWMFDTKAITTEKRYCQLGIPMRWENKTTIEREEEDIIIR
ncbi:Protein FAM72B [Astathelohania contejeani]|uniref:Protein FAM72B n=1 Tax=Astathelohania contejeani TaxID=164912 RepID=A0ABQ7HYN2_9MICR|nr:Protein FAM72B [Thelohania contejeani]